MTLFRLFKNGQEVWREDVAAERVLKAIKRYGLQGYADLIQSKPPWTLSDPEAAAIFKSIWPELFAPIPLPIPLPVVGDPLLLNQQNIKMTSAGIKDQYKVTVPVGSQYFRLSITTDLQADANVVMIPPSSGAYETRINFNNMVDWALTATPIEAINGDYQITILGIAPGQIKISPIVQ